MSGPVCEDLSEPMLFLPGSNTMTALCNVSPPIAFKLKHKLLSKCAFLPDFILINDAG